MQQSPLAKGRIASRDVALNLLASALTILTAIALLATASLVGDMSVLAPVPGQHDAVIRDFYSAVNEALRTGDFAVLDRVVGSDLVFTTPSPRITPDRAGFERYLTGIHANFPAFQLQAEDIVGNGDQAVARVVGGSTEPGGFLGLTFAASPVVWSQFDSFRVANNQIVEVRSGAPSPVVLEPAMQVRLDAQTNLQSLSLERLSASSGESRKWGAFVDSRVLYVDEGAVTIAIEPASSRALIYANLGEWVQPTETSPGTPMTVIAGDAASFPPGSRYTFRQDGSDPDLAAFAVVLQRFSYDGPLQPQKPPKAEYESQEKLGLRATQTALVGDSLPEVLSNATVSFGHALMPPGAGIAFRETDGYTFVAVESGTLVLQVEHDATSLERVDPGAVTLIMPGAPFALHNLGDTSASAVFATVVSIDALPEPLP